MSPSSFKERSTIHMPSSIFLTIGGLLLCHAAYSCLHYRELLRDLQDAGYEGSNDSATAVMIPPMDVWAEVAAAFFIILVAELNRSGSSLRPARGAAKKKMTPLAAPIYRTREFDIYTTRAKAF